MSTLFDIPSKRFAKLARARALDKGYPEYDENQPRSPSGQWGGGSGGGSSGGRRKPNDESSGAFGSLVRSAGGVAAVAAVLAASGVPGVRNVPGLRQLRAKVLGMRTMGAMNRARRIHPADARVLSGRGGAGPYVRAETEALRTLRGSIGRGRFGASQAEINRFNEQVALNPNYDPVNRVFGNQPGIRRVGQPVQPPRYSAHRRYNVT